MKTKLICLIACLAMLIDSTVCVSAEENTVLYWKADGTYAMIPESEVPAVGSNGLPLYRKEYQKTVVEVSGITPGGVYIYGNWATLYTPEQIALIHSLIDSAGITNEMSKCDKAVALNNAVCAALTYDIKQYSQFGDGLYAVQMGGRGVCEHYADLYQTLCQAVGIDCQQIFGWSKENGALGAPHAWNVMSIDGKEYFVDPTWNDGSNNAYLMAEQDFADRKVKCRSTDEEAKWCIFPVEYRTIRNYSPEDAPRFNLDNIDVAGPEAIEELKKAIENDTPIIIKEIPGMNDDCCAE